MSFEAGVVALNAKVGNPTRKLILIAVASHAHKDGTASWQSVRTLAEYAECSPRSVQLHLKELLASGWIREGDQQLVAHYRSDHRPVVYDMAMSEDQRVGWAEAGDNPLREIHEELGRKAHTTPRGEESAPGHWGEEYDATGRRICAQPCPLYFSFTTFRRRSQPCP